MTALDAPAAGAGGEDEDVCSHTGTPAAGQESPSAGEVARAALVTASLQARTIQLAAESVLSGSRDEAESIIGEAREAAATVLTNARSLANAVVAAARREADAALQEAQAEIAAVLGRARGDAEAIRMNARAEADALRERTAHAARQDAEEIVDRALVHRELLLSATLERIATLSSSLIAMSEQIVSHAEDPAIARAQLAHFMLVLTDMAEQVGAEDPEG